MSNTTYADTHAAMWRTGAVHTRPHPGSAIHAFEITDVYGIKPGVKADFTANATTRRGAPPH